MTPNPQIVKSIKQLDYRVTVGEVSAIAGLEINIAQQGLLALAADAGGHLQVAESGDVVYLFPKNFLGILRNKYWQLRWQEWWGKVWKVLFYLIRVSFGIVLIASIILMLLAIAAIVIAISSSGRDDDDRGGSFGGGGMIFLPRFWIGPDFFWWFYPDYNSRRRQRRKTTTDDNQMNFLEAVYSFLFGDGNPNADLEETRYATIGQAIQNNDGAVVAEQIAPYVDRTDADEDYMIPVLARFNGYPEVSPEGEIIYYFPELQVMANRRQKRALPNYLQEQLWRFTQANSSQKMLAIGLGGVNLILALVLGSLLQDPSIAVQLGGLVAFVNSIYGVLVGYGIAFLAIPLIRYFWIQGRNQKISTRNQARESRANILQQASDSLKQKLLFAQQFAQQKVISDRDLAYTTEDDLLDQNLQNADKIDAQWQQRLESNSSD
ncbi:conserved membrane hypothetical protein [Hyella patelloides LEGE 07179]|uniref:Uncharacterized protein n=1 Tax=Hyella patelloides LEGE 07179 TaxID=945734 RepID=A0A563W400_9CYAN|nr:hypothetical protein [Hyella patelloides]VEP18411.1 conserved membrane hypothetical protein [Hyella patelloides LEGE 07179]